MIQYHLTPIELIEVLEPAFGKAVITGFSEEEVKKAEEKLQIKIPAVYREYLLRCGKCSLNFSQDYLYYPEKLELSYDRNREYREDDYDPEDPDWAVDQWTIYGEKKTIINPFGEVFQHPEEEWGQFVKNYLMIWNENQGVWEAGICVDDFEQEDIPVYFPDNLYAYDWKLAFPSIQSFLSWELFDAIDGRESQRLANSKEIQAFFDTEQIELEKLVSKPPKFSDEHLSTFLLPEKNKVGFYFYGYEGYPEQLYIFDVAVCPDDSKTIDE